MVFQLTMFPTGKATVGSSQAVAKVIDIIDRSGYPYKMGAMSTAIEGDWDGVIALIDKARKALRKAHDRVYISIVIDDRKDAKNRLTGKIASVERKLRRKVRS
jgi:uncharacterized protein (TIGR00106 family)